MKAAIIPQINDFDALFARFAAVLDVGKFLQFSDAAGTVSVRVDGAKVPYMFTTDRKHMFSQTVVEKQPTLRTARNGINGNPALQFTQYAGTFGPQGNWLKNTSLVPSVRDNKLFYIVCVCRPTTLGEHPFSFVPDTFSSYANEIDLRILSNAFACRRGSAAMQQGAPDLSAAQIIQIRYDGRTLRLWKNGRLQGTVTTSGENVLPDSLILGNWLINGGDVGPFDGKIGFLGLQTETLPTEAEEELHLAALSARFGRFPVLGVAL